MRSNLGLKILSLALAIVIWLQITLTAEHNATVKLKLELLNAPQSLTLENIPESVPFSVRGKGYDILRMMVNPPQVSIDAANMKAGTTKLAMDDYTVRNHSQNIGVDIIGPAGDLNLEVQSDVLQQKYVHVQPVFADNAARNQFAARNFSFTPEKVSISGPRGLVKGISSVETSQITVAMLSRDSFKMQLISPGHGITLNTDKASFTRVRQQIVSRLIDNVSVSSPSGGSFFPAEATLKVEGPPTVVDALRPETLQARAASEPDPDGWFTLSIELPEGITKFSLTPSRVRLKQ
jgi:hypothetical protein